MIGMVLLNVANSKLKKFSLIEEALASNIFLGIIDTTVFKILATVSTTVSILDSGATKHVSDDPNRFSNLGNCDDFCRTISDEQLTIQGKRILICLLVIMC